MKHRKNTTSTPPRHTQIQQAIELLNIVLTQGGRPADKHMEAYFRQHRNMGVRDRGFVAETVYGCLRRRRFLEYLAQDTSSEALIMAYLLATQGWSARALTEAGFSVDTDADEGASATEGRIPGAANAQGSASAAGGRTPGAADALATRVRTLDKSSLPLEVRTDLPDWLLERLLAHLGESETIALADALNQPATLDLRVNTLKADRDTVARRLAEEGFPAEPTLYSPTGLRRNERTPLFNSASFKEGLFEIQDEGSQLLSLLLEPRRREMVVDFCAGAGGKTLHLAALMANTGTLYAFDTSPKRLEGMKPRLIRAGLDTVRMITIAHERDVRVQRLHGKIDRVLVDAPCSGTGTLRRNPDIKWREINLAEIIATQQRILAAAAKLLKPGGRLVYATCSLLTEENEDVVSDFLAQNPDFHALPVQDILARRQIHIDNSSGMDGALRLYPHRHGTDGFYAAVLERVK
ncbi:MAG: RsmB/NOP family class I SAM-dependent RNA methyltransferase [Gammaproteobacteria bacterium]